MKMSEEQKKVFSMMGKESAKSRFVNKTDAEIKEMMGKLRRGKKKKTDSNIA